MPIYNIGIAFEKSEWYNILKHFGERVQYEKIYYFSYLHNACFDIVILLQHFERR